MLYLTTRFLDVLFSILGLLFLFPLMVLVYLIGLIDSGSPIFYQTRVGKNKKAFVLIKFRTMSIDTKSVATHLASASSVTPFGRFLRKSKLDELPQLVNVLKGEMSLVGPRPNLFSQIDLVKERDQQGVYKVLPGITGLAQISGIDMSTPELLANTDRDMIDNLTLKAYLKYIIMTASGGGAGDRIKK
jgi:lipopolysaccharide/colanic/teichoic acid biosynthesis glycosyltransferase